MMRIRNLYFLCLSLIVIFDASSARSQEQDTKVSSIICCGKARVIAIAPIPDDLHEVSYEIVEANWESSDVQEFKDGAWENRSYNVNNHEGFTPPGCPVEIGQVVSENWGHEGMINIQCTGTKPDSVVPILFEFTPDETGALSLSRQQLLPVGICGSDFDPDAPEPEVEGENC